MFFLLLLAATTVPDDSISVDRHPPTTQYVSFDPAHPPDDVAKLKHGENALTRMFFNCNVKLKYNTIDKRRRDGEWHVVTKIGDIKVTLELTNTIYLPNNVNAKLKAHELGHAKINGMVYDRAEEVARRAAKGAMERTWEASGPDPDSASKAATDAAVEAICNQYLHETADKAFRIGEIYDDITKHGTNFRKEDEAISEAQKKQSEENR